MKRAPSSTAIRAINIQSFFATFTGVPPYGSE
jgi:hypothetical protein